MVTDSKAVNPASSGLANTLAASIILLNNSVFNIKGEDAVRVADTLARLRGYVDDLASGRSRYDVTPEYEAVGAGN